MRLITMWIVGGALASSGCGSSDSGSGGEAGSSGGEAPTITMVAWETPQPCDGATDYTVTVTATDTDTAASDLIYSGGVSACNGRIDAMVSTINCPNIAPYPGTVMVSDPEGNDSLPVAFDIDVCEVASCSADPDTGVCAP